MLRVQSCTDRGLMEKSSQSLLCPQTLSFPRTALSKMHFEIKFHRIEQIAQPQVHKAPLSYTGTRNIPGRLWDLGMSSEGPQIPPSATPAMGTPPTVPGCPSLAWGTAGIQGLLWEFHPSQEFHPKSHPSLPLGIHPLCPVPPSLSPVPLQLSWISPALPGTQALPGSLSCPSLAPSL